MTAVEIAERLHARRSGAGWAACCPAHDDRTPSLSVTERDSRILLHCHAGCSVDSVLAAAGLQMKDLFLDASDDERIVATYDYTDENGTLLFQTVRYEPKDFKQRRPMGHGSWLWGLTGVRRVLYRLPEVLRAESVLVVEGEKDCETARKLGLVATTNSCGSKSEWREEYSESLRDRRVAIICDADAPGLEHGWRVARSLAGIAASIRVIERLPDAKDLTEWVERGGTGEGLVRIIRDMEELKPADVESRGPTAILIPGVLASDVKSQKVRWLWDNHIPFGKVILFDGDPDEGKSLVSIDLAARLTRGQPMPDASTATIPPAGVLLVSLEDDVADTIRPRLEAAGAELSRVRIIDTIVGKDGTERTPTLPEDLPAIEAAIESVKAKMLVLDPLIGMLDSRTNSFRDQDIRRVLSAVKRFAERTGVAVICIRHLNKSGGQNAKYRGGGSIGIIGASRVAFLFANDPEDEGSRIMAPVKGNLWRARPAALRYRMEDQDGQPIVSWQGTTNHTANELLALPETDSAEESNACAEAKNFLLEVLSGGPIGVKDLKREARRAGIAERTLIRAKGRMGIRAQKRGFGTGQHWKWELPKHANLSPKSSNPEHLVPFEQSIETRAVDSGTSAKNANRGDLAHFVNVDGNLRDSRSEISAETPLLTPSRESDLVIEGEL